MNKETIEKEFDEKFKYEFNTKTEIKQFYREKIQDMIDDMVDINFYDWNEDTQRMIKNKIIEVAKKYGFNTDK